MGCMLCSASLELGKIPSSDSFSILMQGNIILHNHKVMPSPEIKLGSSLSISSPMENKYALKLYVVSSHSQRSMVILLHD
jgi:hypothetical protein